MAARKAFPSCHKFETRTKGVLSSIVPDITFRNMSGTHGRIRKFMEMFGKNVKDAFIADAEEEGSADGIRIIPVWKLLLGKSFLKLYTST
jgi:predicted AAA+ superfamily ATPase